MNIRASKFIQDLRGLDLAEKSVAAQMAQHADFKNAECSMSMTTLAEEAGLKNRETASRVVARLVGYGITRPKIRVSKGGRGVTTTYVFTFNVNRDSGVTVKPPRNPSNRDSGITVKPAETVTQPPNNCDSEKNNCDSTPPKTPLTVTPQSHEGISKELPKEEREGKTPHSLAPQAQALEKSNTRTVKPDGIEAVQDLCLQLTGHTDDPVRIRALLEIFELDHVLGGLRDFYTRLPDKKKSIAAMLFFVRGGAAAAIRRYRADKWKFDLRSVATTASTPAIVDDWIRQNPPPAECVTSVDKIVNGAKHIRNRALEAAAIREKEIAENGGADFAEDADHLVSLVNSYPGAKRHLHADNSTQFCNWWVEFQLRAAAKTLGRPLNWDEMSAAVKRLVPEILKGATDHSPNDHPSRRFGEVLFDNLVNEAQEVRS
ncbi:MAG TPA: hypothetical protein VNV41_16485 [Candidatus Acidoferrales bacterium]|jgi:hypothetical protein|nr:hypothetical protein [Candidatus Acidoferrales bacterium]